MQHPAPTSTEAFEAKYREQPDPWNFRASPYERDRYARVLSALGRPRYANAFEPGCSIGEFTAELARRCDRVTATDVSPTALERARGRCSTLSNVRFHRCDIGEEIPDERFDLIVVSEIAYYFDCLTLMRIADQLQRALLPGGELIASHWLGHSVDHVLHGDAVHEILSMTLALRHRASSRYQGFRLDCWIKE